MKPIGMEIQKVASRDLRRVSDEISRQENLLARRQCEAPPPILNRPADVDIPRQTWSGWKPTGGIARQLRRALTEEERSLLKARINELDPWVQGYHETELDEVALSMLDMFGSFPSMRQGGEDAAARVDSVRITLRGFPAWAIVNVGKKIKQRGYLKSDGQVEKHWPPSDPEIVDAVFIETEIYKAAHRTACQLLIAEVES